MNKINNFNRKITSSISVFVKKEKQYVVKKLFNEKKEIE